jgi:hypothetical protein
VAEDDVDVAAQLAQVPDSTSVTDTPQSNGRSTTPADTVLDPGLAVVSDPVETPPVRSSSRSRRARQRSAAVAVTADAVPDEVASSVDAETVETVEGAGEARGAQDAQTEVIPITEDLPADPQDAETGDAEARDAAAADEHGVVDTTDTIDPDVVADEDQVTEVVPVPEDAADLDTAADLESDRDVSHDDAALLDTEAIPVVEGGPATEVLPVVEESPQGLVETEILPDVEPRIYDVETDEPGAYVSLVPAVTEPAALPAEVEDEPEAPVVVRRRRRRPRVRRVTRVIRHVDTWTVFKVVVLFNIVLYAATLIAGVLLWNVAHGTGTVGNVERFMESFGWETFEFNGQEIFDGAWRIGMFVALGLTGLAVLAATTFNLITDIVGGIRVTVLEEEVVVAAPEMPRKPKPTPPADA